MEFDFEIRRLQEMLLIYGEKLKRVDFLNIINTQLIFIHGIAIMRVQYDIRASARVCFGVLIFRLRKKKRMVFEPTSLFK